MILELDFGFLFNRFQMFVLDICGIKYKSESKLYIKYKSMYGHSINYQKKESR